MITSHRVEAEADRASRAHAKKTLKRQSTSAARVHDRVAARETAKRLKCLQACPIFASLAEASIGAIVDAMEYEVAEPGHVLCQQGREADRMFLLMSGTCDVLVGDAKVAQLTDLDVFGEAALFPDATGAFVRTATVRVAGGAGAPATASRAAQVRAGIPAGERRDGRCVRSTLEGCCRGSAKEPGALCTRRGCSGAAAIAFHGENVRSARQVTDDGLASAVVYPGTCRTVALYPSTGPGY